jgi:hypothetical protein
MPIMKTRRQARTVEPNDTSTPPAPTPAREELGRTYQKAVDTILVADRHRERSGMTWRFEHFDPPEPAEVNIMGDAVR